MAAPTTTPLGGTTLARKWKLDVDTSATTTPTWTRVMGIAEFKPNLDSTMQDDSDYDSGGYKSSTSTAIEWGCEFKVMRKPQQATPTTYDPGQEALRLAAQQLGAANSVHVRFYEDNGTGGPKVEAYDGYASVNWTPDGGGMDELDSVSVQLGGQGRRNVIAHPLAP